VSKKTLSQHLHEFLEKNPPLPQLIREFVLFADLYFDAARRLSCVHEAQNICPLAGREFRDAWNPAHKGWKEAKQDVLRIGARLSRAMTDNKHKTKRLLKLLDAIEQDGARSGCPGSVDPEEWRKTKATLQQIALQAETDASKGTPQAEWAGDGSEPTKGERAEGTGRRGRKRRGRPSGTDRQKDQSVRDAWQTGRYKKHAELARELRMSEREVRLALDRVRKRRKKSLGKNLSSPLD
jgi:hypothetical protein